ncbi:hypothetical protein CAUPRSCDRAFT_13191 [Caulochytrium protostelioides]|uniref:Uncharacterized protein n=1 Tax=Caulochytrium protostelioides TaxID=1555241 RepID=A0A4P9WV66_9FUNG|nr:hypothetical protein CAUPRSCDRAFT_13191 [Caulochytrium protostelioides]
MASAGGASDHGSVASSGSVRGAAKAAPASGFRTPAKSVTGSQTVAAALENSPYLPSGSTVGDDGAADDAGATCHAASSSGSFEAGRSPRDAGGAMARPCCTAIMPTPPRRVGHAAPSDPACVAAHRIACGHHLMSTCQTE